MSEFSCLHDADICGRLVAECCAQYRERTFKEVLGVVARWGESEQDQHDYEWLADQKQAS